MDCILILLLLLIAYRRIMLTFYLAADTIRILVATDNHVGYAERDAERGDDSWKSFHEVMCLAKEKDVDMVLLAGDLFHDNKPSRKSMYNVMRSLRMNCYGDKPCELEMLSDGSDVFQGYVRLYMSDRWLKESYRTFFDHVNYEDPDINVAIPVFSIHGNHDDPSGVGQLHLEEVGRRWLTFVRKVIWQLWIYSKQPGSSIITAGLPNLTMSKSSQYYYKKGTPSLHCMV